MADYRLTFAHSSIKELGRLDPPIARRVMASVEKLPHDPRPPGCVKLQGSESRWRIRIGDWRVVYTVDDGARIVDIVAVRHRSDVYR
ncbi:MAG: type II toxin-antitoxin system RelE/ParE family toxin [Tepidisphaeraceae bacterium]